MEEQKVISINKNRSQNNVIPLLEALLYRQDKPVTVQYITDATGYSKELIKISLKQMQEHLENDNHGLMLNISGVMVELIPKPMYQVTLKQAKKSDFEKNVAVVDEFLYVLQSRGRSQKTVDHYERIIKNMFKIIAKSVNEIETRDIRFYLMQQKQKGNIRNTIRNKVSVLKSFFNWLEEEDLVENNPSRKIEKPKEDKKPPKHISREELEEIREETKKLIDRVIVEVLYSSAIRVSEAINLDWCDIDFANKILHVRNGKGGKSRTTFLSSKAVMLLQKHKREQRNDDNPWVFQTQWRGDNRMSKETMERHIKSLGKKANISKKLTPHVFRHSLATHLLESGVSIDKIQILLGHSTVATTQIYAKTNINNLEHEYRNFLP